MTKINYIIYTPDYSMDSGGYSALHYLSEVMHTYGVNEVFLTTNFTNPRWYSVPLESILNSNPALDLNLKFLKFLVWLRGKTQIPTVVRKISRKIRRSYPNFVWKFLDKEKTVVIYAENEPGNPLNAKHIVRWILMSPKKDSGNPVYDTQEHIFLYHAFYNVEERYKTQIKGVLTSIDMEHNLSIYFDKNLPRQGGAYLVRKGTNKTHDKHPPNYVYADKLLVGMSDEEKCSFFNKIDTFISYDCATFITIQAALCGCKVIIIPDEGGEFSVENLKNTNRNPGLAYGFDDVEWAQATLPQLRKSMEDLNQKNIDSIKAFIKYWNCFMDHQ